MIPVIPADRVLAGSADREIMAGAEGSGFLTLSGVDAALDLAPLRDGMLGFFQADNAVRWSVVRHKYDPSSPHIYRGYFPPEGNGRSLLEGFDIGPDIADPARAGDGSDPLTEPTPRPDLPGWAEAAGDYYTRMAGLGDAITRALFRALGADEALAARYFDRTISTLRLFRYPPLDRFDIPAERHLLQEDGTTRYVMAGRHTDSGFVTLLWQDTTGGLQAESHVGWIDVPPADGGLVVNFGQMLEDWSGGRVRATPHRVLGGLTERFSIPFFYEPAVDAVIEPLVPGRGQPFVYGDFLWERMVRFPNFRGVTRRPAA
ncbi:MAG: 2OG-Fe(II) oxygenase family protein [Pseudomonadota bacterium]